jgi:hypothetical protein
MLVEPDAAASRALLQPPSPFLVARQRLRKNLQRHRTANTRIEVAVNLAHFESGVLPVSLHRQIPFVSLGGAKSQAHRSGAIHY